MILYYIILYYIILHYILYNLLYYITLFFFILYTPYPIKPENHRLHSDIGARDCRSVSRGGRKSAKLGIC